MLDVKVIDALKEKFGKDIVDTTESCSDFIVNVNLGSLHDILSFLHSNLSFDYLLFLTAADYPKREKRFDMIYQLRSTATFDEIRIKAEVSDGEDVESVSDIWGSAIGDECETYDMFGIKFLNNAELRRAFMPDDWNGYPLRKEYPLKGDEFSDRYLDKYLPEGQRHQLTHTRMP